MADKRYRRAPGRRGSNRVSRRKVDRSQKNAGSGRDTRPDFGAHVMSLSRKGGRRRHASKRTTSSPVRKVGRQRLKLILVAVTIASLLLGGRAVYLSVAEVDGPQAMAAEQSTETRDVASGRGDILSADGRKLATSLDRYHLIATPYQIENPKEVASRLSKLAGPELGQTEEQIESELTERDARGNLGGYSVIGSIEPQTAEKIRDLSYEGLNLAPTAVRAYPDGQLASQVTGYLGDYGRPFGGLSLVTMRN